MIDWPEDVPPQEIIDAPHVPPRSKPPLTRDEQAELNRKIPQHGHHIDTLAKDNYGKPK